MLAEPSKNENAFNDATASIAIYGDNSYDFETVVPQIKVLVSNAIPGLNYENVSIALFEKKRNQQAAYQNIDGAMPVSSGAGLSITPFYVIAPLAAVLLISQLLLRRRERN